MPTYIIETKFNEAGEWRPLGEAKPGSPPIKFGCRSKAEEVMETCFKEQVHKQRIGGEELVRVKKLKR